ncbi:hypothetical protein F3Y22_tig00110548pilonHSYRG00917 [Hibiscus syriacus]|uniref:Carbohydrate kinase PfkB domain-containing protein n=1 Tax=Hibiscus syriacus TaxID=106335 RepID=A0A6A3ABU7_HIBSY|nr:hypothetical protein F3Y22_tig00110548pilonHSYRG00917 [Hibiscus syriacus]
MHFIGNNIKSRGLYDLCVDLRTYVNLWMVLTEVVTKLTSSGIGTLTGRLFVGTAEKIPPLELVDTTGAGDAFIAAVLYDTFNYFKYERLVHYSLGSHILLEINDPLFRRSIASTIFLQVQETTLKCDGHQNHRVHFPYALV